MALVTTQRWKSGLFESHGESESLQLQHGVDCVDQTFAMKSGHGGTNIGPTDVKIVDEGLQRSHSSFRVICGKAAENVRSEGLW